MQTASVTWTILQKLSKRVSCENGTDETDIFFLHRKALSFLKVIGKKGCRFRPSCFPCLPAALCRQIVLLDVLTNQGIEGHAIVFTYTPAALKPVAELSKNCQAASHSENLSVPIKRRHFLLGKLALSTA